MGNGRVNRPANRVKFDNHSELGLKAGTKFSDFFIFRKFSRDLF